VGRERYIMAFPESNVERRNRVGREIYIYIGIEEDQGNEISPHLRIGEFVL